MFKNSLRILLTFFLVFSRPAPGFSEIKPSNNPQLSGAAITPNDISVTSSSDGCFDIDTADNTLTVDCSANRVGIGTASPDVKTHIQDGDASYTPDADSRLVVESDDSVETAISIGSLDSSRGSVLFQSPTTASNGSILYYHKDDSLADTMILGVKNETLKVSITETGIGIGVNGDSPAEELHIEESNGAAIIRQVTYDDGASVSTIELRKSDTDTLGSLSQTDDDDGLGNVRAYGVDTGGNAELSADILFEQDGTAGGRVPGRILFRTATDVATVAERMRIDSSGNVGIGTASPTTKLDVRDNSSDSIGWGSTSSRFARLTYTTNLARILAESGNDLSLGAGGTFDQVYLDSDGNVGIGTTNPISKLHVQDGVVVSSTTSGWGQYTAFGDSGGCLMIRDTDDAGYTQCDALDGTLSCSADDGDGVCD